MPTGVKGTPPTARSYHTMAAVGNKLYIFGGCCTAGRLNDLHCFDTEALTWQVRCPPTALMASSAPLSDGQQRTTQFMVSFLWSAALHSVMAMVTGYLARRDVGGVRVCSILLRA